MKVALIAPREVSRWRVERCLSHQCRTRARMSSRGAIKATFGFGKAVAGLGLKQATSSRQFGDKNRAAANGNERVVGVTLS